MSMKQRIAKLELMGLRSPAIAEPIILPVSPSSDVRPPIPPGAAIGAFPRVLLWIGNRLIDPQELGW